MSVLSFVVCLVEVPYKDLDGPRIVGLVCESHTVSFLTWCDPELGCLTRIARSRASNASLQQAFPCSYYTQASKFLRVQYRSIHSRRTETLLFLFEPFVLQLCLSLC